MPSHLSIFLIANGRLFLRCIPKLFCWHEQAPCEMYEGSTQPIILVTLIGFACPAKKMPFVTDTLQVCFRRFWKCVAVTTLKTANEGQNVAGKEDKLVSGSTERVCGALENVWEQSLLFMMLYIVGKAESEQACWASLVYINKASGTDSHRSIGEAPATRCIYMESWLPFTFIWHDVLSIGFAFLEEQNSSCGACALCDLQTCVHGHKLC